jgi:hypothetical protein
VLLIPAMMPEGTARLAVPGEDRRRNATSFMAD